MTPQSSQSFIRHDCEVASRRSAALLRGNRCGDGGGYQRSNDESRTRAREDQTKRLMYESEIAQKFCAPNKLGSKQTNAFFGKAITASPESFRSGFFKNLSAPN